MWHVPRPVWAALRVWWRRRHIRTPRRSLGGLMPPSLQRAQGRRAQGRRRFVARMVAGSHRPPAPARRLEWRLFQKRRLRREMVKACLLTVCGFFIWKRCWCWRLACSLCGGPCPRKGRLGRYRSSRCSRHRQGRHRQARHRPTGRWRNPHPATPHAKTSETPSAAGAAGSRESAAQCGPASSGGWSRPTTRARWRATLAGAATPHWNAPIRKACCATW